MAPEQIRGSEPDGRADLYALGCVLFEMFTGERPFPSANENAESWAHANDPRPRATAKRPDLDPRYDQVVARAMAIDPGDRFGSGAEFARALEAVSAGRPVDEPTGEMTAATAIGVPAGQGYRPTRVEPAYAAAPGVPTPSGPAGGTPTPGPERRGAGRSVALVLVALIAAAGIAVGAIAASGGFGRDSGTTTTPAAQKTPPQKAKPKPRTPTTTVATTPTRTVTVPAKTPTGTSSATDALTPCDGNISASQPQTSCSFANNVFYEYWRADGNPDVSAYSPTTGQTYSVNCVPAGEFVMCQTPEGAKVRIRQGALGSYSQSQADRYAATHDTGP
jgi:serine/threonine-protein kinase